MDTPSLPFHARRVPVAPARHAADTNIRKRFAIEDAQWIWHPGVPSGRASAVRFLREWASGEDEEVLLHVTADQRYVLYLDGQRLSMGPDRSDTRHWSFATLSLTIPAGAHRLVADVHWLPENWRPGAQETLRPGFLLKAEGSSETLDTGAAGWRCAERRGLSARVWDEAEYRAIWTDTGTPLTFDGELWSAPLDAHYVEAEGVGAYWDSRGGAMKRIWGLAPTPLPEQIHRRCAPGRVRAAWHSAAPEAVPAASDETLLADVGRLLREGAPWTVPAHDTLQVIWDLENYYSAFSHLVVSGGKGASVSFEWAEAPYLHEDPRNLEKGNRDEIAGRFFRTNGDKYLCSGRGREEFNDLWWHAGRYVRLVVKTAGEPLVVRELAIDESRYPLEDESGFSATPSRLADVSRIAVRGIQMCAHETFMDCPFYEQLQYVGDGRLEALAYYAISRDLALPRRVLELFAWSQPRTGFIGERYPSDTFQLSLTYSMLFPSAVRDYLTWRDDLEWSRRLLAPLRCLMENFIELLDGRDAIPLAEIPGWSFVDWVDTWNFGYPPTGPDGYSGSVQLHLAGAFRDAAWIERAIGDPRLAERLDDYAERFSRRARELFWDEGRGLFAEDTGHTVFSEHAQGLALHAGVASPAGLGRAVRVAEKPGSGLAPASIYFSFYLLELYARAFRENGDLAAAEALARKLAFWEGLADEGLKTPVESPHPRSDCHAWGSHPLFHFHASIAGIRPASAGFRSADIRPMLHLPYDHLHSVLPHPRGRIELAWRKEGGRATVEVSLPEGVPATFRWGALRRDLAPGGRATILCPLRC